MDTITDILARPGEAARQLTEIRAALEEKQSECIMWRELADSRNSLTAKLAAERDAARAEVARLTAALEQIVKDGTNSNGALVTASADYAYDVLALRGDTAQAQAAKSAMDEPTAAVTARTVKWEGGIP